jgi:hypothetical protein
MKRGIALEYCPLVIRRRPGTSRLHSPDTENSQQTAHTHQMLAMRGTRHCMSEQNDSSPAGSARAMQPPLLGLSGTCCCLRGLAWWDDCR